MRIHIFTALLACILALNASPVAAGDPPDGTIIFDMTANPGDVAIDVNLDFITSGSKSATAIETGFGGNVINIPDFQVLSRDTTKGPHELKLTIGIDDDTVRQDQFGDDGQLAFFADGNHLFDLNRLRDAADWMARPDNLSPDTGVPPGTYGTISFAQFLFNIQQGYTMYGLVRVKVPLELGTCTTVGNCDRNALGDLVERASIYGFCETSTGLCSCAPYDGYKLIEGDDNCAQTLPDTAQIRVKGMLLWDFVASVPNVDAGLNTGDPIPLTLLPWAPRELYFKVEVPIMVNWEYDADLDGAMDNMFNIKAVSNNGVNGTISQPTVTYDMVAPTNRAEYRYYTGQELTPEVFTDLDDASKYHLMMPNGYTTGWAEAFNKLNITGKIWQSMPAQPAFGLPEGVEDTILTVNVVRSDSFEDIPAYLYSGGLIDMHDHVNISGLVYVPQGMELEAKNKGGWDGFVPPTRQYIIGAVLVRDTFFLEAKTDTITVISSEPSTYSTAVVSESFAGSRSGGGADGFSFAAALAETPNAETDETDGSDPSGTGGCYTGCTSGSTGSSGGKPPGANRWMEIRPQIKN